MGQIAEELGLVPAPASLIGVAMLFEPDVLVEIEATAVVDGPMQQPSEGSPAPAWPWG